MDSEVADNTPQTAPPKSGAERVRKHRKRRQQLDMQVAYGVAKLVTGQGAGDQAKAILVLLEKAGHFELVDPQAAAWAQVKQEVLTLLKLTK